MGYINFVRCQLATSITSTSTSITLSSNTSPFNLPPTDGGTLVLADSINKPSKLEIITYTSRSGLVLSGVVRGAESTTAQAWPSSSYCYMSFTALMLTAFKADMDAALRTVVNKQDKHTNLTALSGITSGTGLFKRATDGSWVLDTTQYSTVTLASAIPLAGTTSGSVGTSLKAAKEDHTHPIQTSVSGNAGTATKLASPISFTFTGGATGSLSSFDGSSNITINLTVDANSHTHGLATASINGLMSSAQFTKLSGIDSNANKYVHPTGAGHSHIPTSGTNVNYFLKSGTNDTYSWSLLSKTDVGLSNVDNTSDINKPLSTATSNALLTKVNTSSVGVVNGLATLDARGLVPSNQLPKTSSSTYGVVKLSTDTPNTIAVNTLSSVVNRTYQIQKNDADVLVVNIPWTDTVYTHPTSGVVPGTYKSVTVNANGHITSGSNPTTLAGYGITDAQSYSANLTSLAGLSTSTTGLLKLTNGVASFDTNKYLTTNQTINVSGDATGSGTTAITLTLANSGVVAGTYKSITVDAKGRVTSGTNPTTLAGYGITDAASSIHNHTVDGLSNVVITAKAVNDILQWNGAVWVNKTIAGAGLQPAGSYLTGNQSISITGDATGSGTTSIVLTLTNSGVTAGTYKSVTVDAKGRITSGSNPTTLAGYGITDAQPVDADLTAIAGLAGTSGLLKKTAANTWVLDTTSYIPLVTLTDSGTGSLLKLTRDAYGRVSGTAAVTATDITGLSGLFGSTVGTALAATGSSGSSNTPARADHVHPLPSVATQSVNGLMSSGDKKKLDNLGAFTSQATLITNWNNANYSGVFMGNETCANAPESGKWFMGNVENHGGAGHCTQTLHGFANDTPTDTLSYRREFNNGTWGSWYRLRLSEEEQKLIFLSLTGGTMTGDLVLKGDATKALHPVTLQQLQSFKLPWSDIQSKPTTLSGFGITDAAPSSHIGSTGTTHGVASSSVNGFMSSTDKSKLDALNLSATSELVGSTDSGIKPVYTSTANAYRAGSNITLSISDGTSLTADRNHHGSISKVESYLQNTSTFSQDLFGVLGFSYLYGGGSSPSNDGNIFGGYYVATAACTSTSNKYVGWVVGTYSSAIVDVTNSIVGGAYGVYADVTVKGITNPTGSINNVYGLYISLSGVNTYANNLYSIYCSEPNALGYLAGGLNIGTLNPNNVNGGITLQNNSIYLYSKGKIDTCYGLDVDGFVADNGNWHVIHSEYGIKFVNDYLSTRESSDSKTLDWYEESSASLTSSGLTTDTSATAKLTRNGNLVAIDIPSIVGAGTATTFKLTGIPVQFRPLVTKEFLVRGTVGEVVSICRAIINKSGEIQVYAGLSSETFSTTSSTRGINKISLSYQLH